MSIEIDDYRTGERSHPVSIGLGVALGAALGVAMGTVTGNLDL